MSIKRDLDIQLPYRMKNKRTQIITLAVLIAASMSSYIYLNVSNLEYQGAREITTEQSMLQDLDETTEKSNLPDIRLLKKAAALGRKILPGS